MNQTTTTQLQKAYGFNALTSMARLFITSVTLSSLIRRSFSTLIRLACHLNSLLLKLSHLRPKSHLNATEVWSCQISYWVHNGKLNLAPTKFNECRSSWLRAHFKFLWQTVLLNLRSISNGCQSDGISSTITFRLHTKPANNISSVQLNSLHPSCLVISLPTFWIILPAAQTLQP
jgi:hypothetical protein